MARTKSVKRERAAAASLQDKAAQRPPSGFFGGVFDQSHLDLALVVSNKVQLNDVALIALTVKRDDDLGTDNLEVVIEPQSYAYGISEETSELFVRTTLLLSAYRPSPDATRRDRAISIEATFGLMYTCDEAGKMPVPNLEAFAGASALHNLWPFCASS